MKKYLAMFLAAVLMLCSLTACAKNSNQTGAKEETNEKIKIVTTIFPEYDWVREVLGDEVANADLTMLLDSGVDLHSFQPTADDIMKIADCDLFVYVGGESDEWVEDALEEATNKDMKVINLLDTLGDKAKEEELVEGMEGEEEEEGEEAEEEEGSEYDEHVWLSLKNAQLLVSAISDALCEIDADKADTYQANASAYNDKLAKLDGEYKAAVEAGTYDTLLFGDRFPFRYMVNDYNLNYYAAFIGCSAETEASFETITFLANKVDECKLHTVVALEGSDQKIAETIISNTADKNQKIAVLDSMQSVTGDDVESGVTYLSIMENNLKVLADALK